MKKPDLLLLHGALGSATQLEALAPFLEEVFTVHTYNFPGHGGKPFAEHPLDIPVLAEHLLDHLREFHLIGCKVFGYSMGGYVALHLEATKPGCFASIMTFGTKFHWNTDIAARETKLIDPEFLLKKAVHFTEMLQHRHQPNDWKEVCKQTTQLMHTLGRHPMTADDFAKVACPVRVVVGDRDQMVSIDESRDVFTWLPKADLLVMPSTPHLFEKLNHSYLSEEIIRFNA